MGKDYREYLNNTKVYACKTCKSHVTSYDKLMSKNFSGKYGRAFLFHSSINVHYGEREEKMLLTGRHITRDMFCNFCTALLGWRYDRAYEHN